MRWRLFERRGSPFTCCFCCHVRTGTLFLGALSLIFRLLTIILTLVIVAQQEVDHHHDSDNTTPKHGSNFFFNSGISSTVSSVVNSSSTAANHALGRGDQRVIELILNIGSVLFIVSLLYGVIKGCAKFLLPFFCLQVFDFCLSTLVIIGFFTYEPNVKQWIIAQKWFPMKDQLVTLTNGWLVLMAGSLAICCLWIKAYCIGVVWSCYKYLIQLHSTMPLHGTGFTIDEEHFIASQLPTGRATVFQNNDFVVTPVTTIDSEILLPPKYEDVLMMSEPAAASNRPPSPLPPTYSEAVEAEAAARNI